MPQSRCALWNLVGDVLRPHFGRVSMRAGEPTEVYDWGWMRPPGVECGCSRGWQQRWQRLAVSMDVRLKGSRGVTCQNISGDTDPRTRGCLGTCHQ